MKNTSSSSLSKKSNDEDQQEQTERMLVKEEKDRSSAIAILQQQRHDDDDDDVLSSQKQQQDVVFSSLPASNTAILVVKAGEEETRVAKDTKTTTTTSRKRHGARNQHRHKFFVKWIMEKFPKAVQQAKDDGSSKRNEDKDDHRCRRHHLGHRCHVLDIAGGKGELSARLTLCHSLFVQMVDPRPANLYDCFYKNIYRSLPKKWQEKISVQDDKGTTTQQQPDSADKIQCILDSRFHQFVKPFPCDGGLDDDDDDDNDDGKGGSSTKIPAAVIQLKQDPELLQAVENCTLMIGLHADGATEAIVDIALYYQKPFVVVPCCVFPNFFRHRMVPSLPAVDNSDSVDDENMTMVPVRTHEQFCQYLAMKDSHFVMETLPFEGRNVGIWWDGIHRDGDD